MTLLEVTVVILVLLSLITVLFIGAKAWKRGSDRSICIIHIHAVQKGVRAYSNLYGFEPGGMAPNLQNQVIGLGRFVEVTPNCPASGIYSFGAQFGNEIIPPIGELYLTCDLADSSQHEPFEHSGW